MKKYPSIHYKTKKRSRIKIPSSQSKTVKHIGGGEQQYTIKPPHKHFVELTNSPHEKIPEENNLFKEFSGCTGNSLNVTDKNELLKLLNSEVNSCKNVEFKIFGLSLAAINLLLSFLIFIFILSIIKNEKNK